MYFECEKATRILNEIFMMGIRTTDAAYQIVQIRRILDTIWSTNRIYVRTPHTVSYTHTHRGGGEPKRKSPPQQILFEQERRIQTPLMNLQIIVDVIFCQT